MSGIDSLLEAIRSTYARIGEIEAVAEKFPHDRHVLASLGSVKAHARQLEEQWEEECRVNLIEVCRYRLVAPNTERYSATSFAKSLLEFQELFSQIFDALKHGAKQRARVSGQVLSETQFGFAYTYPGSLGVVLTLQEEPTLFPSKFEDAVRTFNEITTIDHEDAVRDAAKTLGDAVIKKVYDWSSVNYDAGFNVDITWTGVEGYHSGKMIQRNALGRMVDLIGRTKEIEHRKFRVTGTLVMIDVVKKKFRFVVPDGEDYPGTISGDFNLSKQWTVNKTYVAEIEVEAITRYATMRTEQNYTLISLDPEARAHAKDEG